MSVWLAAVLFGAGLLHAEVIPPVPQNHFNDYANVASRSTAEQLNRQLQDFERQTSSQLLVAIYPKMESNSSIEDYATRVYNSWKVGLKGSNNGAVLFIFINDRKMRIQTGYGLEGALPDAICKRIIEDEIAPHFKAGQYDAGLRVGVDAMIRAAQGEYKGSGKTVKDTNRRDGSPNFFLWIFVAVVILILLSPSRRRGRYYTRRGSGWGTGWSTGWGGGGGGWSSGGGSDFGGSFSSGGGDSGGGGASGSW